MQVLPKVTVTQLVLTVKLIATYKIRLLASRIVSFKVQERTTIQAKLY